MNNSRLIGSMILACVGCASSPARIDATATPPDAAASRRSDAASIDGADASADASIAGVDAAVPIPRGPVSLDQLLAYARAHAPRSILADATRFGAEAGLIAARQRALYNPVVRVSLGSRTQSSDTGLEAQVGISQRLEVAGERRRRIATAELGAEQIERERTATHWEVEVEVRRLYGLALILGALTDLSQEASVAARELADATRKRAEAGEEPHLALELALARMALTEARTESIRADHDAMIGRLCAAAGWPADEPLKLRDERGPLPSPPLDPALVAMALDHNRDKAALEASIAQARAAHQQARREAWPEPSLGASYAREAGVAGSSAAHVVLGTLSVPVPSFGRNQGDRARARARHRTAESALLAFERGLAGRVGEAAARVRGALGRIDALREVATAADLRRLSALRAAYDAGEVGLLELLRALEQTIETRTAILAAEADYVDARADLELVIGTRLDPEAER